MTAGRRRPGRAGSTPRRRGRGSRRKARPRPPVGAGVQLDLLGPDQHRDLARFRGRGRVHGQVTEHRLHHSAGQDALEQVGVADEAGQLGVGGSAYRSWGAANWAILPSRSTATRSAIDSASSWSWVTRTVVVPRPRGGSACTSARTLARRCGVERRERLVEQDDLGLDGQRPGQGHPLLLAAGELVGVAAGPARPGPPRRAGRPPGRAGAPGAGRPKATLPPTVRWGNRLPSWGT